MKNEINYTAIILKINGEEVSWDSTNWRYLPPVEYFESKVLTDWKDIEAIMELTTGRTQVIYNRKGEAKGIRVWESFGKKIYKKNKIQSIQIIEKPVVKNANDFSFEQLQKILPAGDFVRWLKDNGITKIF